MPGLSSGARPVFRCPASLRVPGLSSGARPLFRCQACPSGARHRITGLAPGPIGLAPDPRPGTGSQAWHRAAVRRSVLSGEPAAGAGGDAAGVGGQRRAWIGGADVPAIGEEVLADQLKSLRRGRVAQIEAEIVDRPTSSQQLKRGLGRIARQRCDQCVERGRWEAVACGAQHHRGERREVAESADRQRCAGLQRSTSAIARRSWSHSRSGSGQWWAARCTHANARACGRDGARAPGPSLERARRLEDDARGQ